MWKLKIYSYAGSYAERIYETLEELVENEIGSDFLKELEGLTEKEKLSEVEEALNWLDVPFSPYDDSRCFFKLENVTENQH